MENEEKKKRIDVMRVVQNGLLFLICAMAVIGFGGVVITDDLITMNGANNTGGNLLNYTTITDSIATLTAGAWTGLVSVTATTFDDGTASLSGGVLTDADLSGSIIANGDELVRFYAFDEASGTTAYDTKNNEDVTVTNGALIVSSQFGNARDFDGDNDYIKGTNFNMTNSSLTVECWINAECSGESGQVIIGKDLSYRFMLSNSTGLITWVVATSDNAWYSKTAATTTDACNTGWHHLVGVYDGSQLDVYIDGVSEDTETGVTGTVLPTNNDFFISAQYLTSGNFNGTIDEVKVYNRSLSSQEVMSNYVSGISAQSPDGHLMPKTGANYSGIVYHEYDADECWIDNDGDIVLCICVNSTDDALITSTQSDCAA